MKSAEELLKEISSQFIVEEGESQEETVFMLIIDCLETGIDYWNTRWPKVLAVSEDCYTEDVWKALKRGETLQFGNDEYIGELSLKTMARALKSLQKSDKDTYDEITTVNWDACSCDAFFQTAVFGEVIFG